MKISKKVSRLIGLAATLAALRGDIVIHIPLAVTSPGDSRAALVVA